MYADRNHDTDATYYEPSPEKSDEDCEYEVAELAISSYEAICGTQKTPTIISSESSNEDSPRFGKSTVYADDVSNLRKDLFPSSQKHFSTRDTLGGIEQLINSSTIENIPIPEKNKKRTKMQDITNQDKDTKRRRLVKKRIRKNLGIASSIPKNHGKKENRQESQSVLKERIHRNHKENENHQEFVSNSEMLSNLARKNLGKKENLQESQSVLKERIHRNHKENENHQESVSNSEMLSNLARKNLGKKENLQESQSVLKERIHRNHKENENHRESVSNLEMLSKVARMLATENGSDQNIVHQSSQNEHSSQRSLASKTKNFSEIAQEIAKNREVDEEQRQPSRHIPAITPKFAPMARKVAPRSVFSKVTPVLPTSQIRGNNISSRNGSNISRSTMSAPVLQLPRSSQPPISTEFNNERSNNERNLANQSAGHLGTELEKTLLPILQRVLTPVLDKLAVLGHQMEDMGQDLKNVWESHTSLAQLVSPISINVEEVYSTTREALTNSELKVSDEYFRNSLITTLQQAYITQDLNVSVRRLMKALFADELLKQFCFKGKSRLGGKEKFVKLKMCGIIKESLMKSKFKYTVDNIESSMSKDIANASTRLKRKEQKENEEGGDGTDHENEFGLTP